MMSTISSRISSEDRGRRGGRKISTEGKRTLGADRSISVDVALVRKSKVQRKRGKRGKRGGENTRLYYTWNLARINAAVEGSCDFLFAGIGRGARHFASLVPVREWNARGSRRLLSCRRRRLEDFKDFVTFKSSITDCWREMKVNVQALIRQLIKRHAQKSCTSLTRFPEQRCKLFFFCFYMKLTFSCNFDENLKNHL